MLTSKTLKAISLVLSVLSASVGLAGSFVADKRQSLEMNELVDTAVEQKMMEMSIPETTEEEL